MSTEQKTIREGIEAKIREKDDTTILDVIDEIDTSVLTCIEDGDFLVHRLNFAVAPTKGFWKDEEAYKKWFDRLAITNDLGVDSKPEWNVSSYDNLNEFKLGMIWREYNIGDIHLEKRIHIKNLDFKDEEISRRLGYEGKNLTITIERDAGNRNSKQQYNKHRLYRQIHIIPFLNEKHFRYVYPHGRGINSTTLTQPRELYVGRIAKHLSGSDFESFIQYCVHKVKDEEINTMRMSYWSKQFDCSNYRKGNDYFLDEMARDLAKRLRPRKG